MPLAIPIPPGQPAVVPAAPPPAVPPEPCALTDQATALALAADPAWLAQKLPPGRRVLVRRAGRRVTAADARGRAVRLPAAVVAAVRGLDTPDCVLDGLLDGGRLVLVDLPAEAGEDLGPRPLLARLVRLLDLMESATSDALRYAPFTGGTDEKRAMVARLRAAGAAAGVALRRKDAPYVAGPPAAGGADWLVLRFAPAPAR